ncbi:nuclear protein localization protein 4 [Tulasnella sp. JGI-2019a]|nr:nuclear protein localization protein 4 [Tulasnella sp. JGI-2019a]
MLIRVRSKDGNFRLELQPTDDGSILAKKVIETTIDADPESVTMSNQPRGGELPLSMLHGRTVGSLGLKHGDLLFIAYKAETSGPATTIPTGAATSSTAIAPSAASSSSAEVPIGKRPWELAHEDPVDTYWRQKDGKIPRTRDPQFCKHGPNGMCDYCMPLEPYDAKYHADHSIKHLSFHSYLRKVAPPKPGAQAGSSAMTPPLDPLDYKVKIPCPSGSHKPWPEGICTKCQPSAITLQSQPFRMVDHLEFASPAIIDRFLGGWRSSGDQRFGWMIGRYEKYDVVPMGVKAVVEAVHEPPQEGDLDGLSLELPWEDEARIKKLARMCSKGGEDDGLKIVGMIWTDLTPDTEDRTKSVCKRHADSYFLSSLETLFAAKVQNSHPAASKSSPTGVFSSRMVTAVLSGTPEGGIDVSAYMASEQACAMIEADMIEPSVDPGIVRVKEEADGRYIPDVFYRFRNEYGLEVKQSAKPCFPVEYLLATLTHGFPTVSTPAFLSTEFSIENRPGAENQDMSEVIKELSRLKAPQLAPGQGTDATSKVVKYLSDWHLIAFLGGSGVLSESDLQTLVKAITHPEISTPNALDPVLKTEGWHTLMAIAGESGPTPSRPSRSAPSAPGGDFPDIPPEAFDEPAENSGGKVCPHCTFVNPTTATDCEVCGLPLEG